jgi:cytidyltransferase-like protein
VSGVPKAPVIVMASGVFDLLHRGHYNLLWRAAQLGDLLVVGVVSDDGARAYKEDWPVQMQWRRLAAVARLPFVSLAEIQETTDPTPLLERWRPDLLVHGDDWDRLLAGQETVERLHIEWKLLPYTEGISTTLLRAGG